jgi:hypothetical protein
MTATALNLPVECDGDGDGGDLLFGNRFRDDIVYTRGSCRRNGLSRGEPGNQNNYGEQAQANAQQHV